MFIELKSFCFFITECLRSKIILFFHHRVSAAENHFVFSSQSVCGRKSFLFFRHRVSAAENHFCFFIPECLRSKIIFVFPSQSASGRKSFLFFYHRVSAVENHFCFSITECLRSKIIFVFPSQSVCGRIAKLFLHQRACAIHLLYIYMLKLQTHRGGIFIARIGYITAPLVTQTEGENLAAPNAA